MTVFTFNSGCDYWLAPTGERYYHGTPEQFAELEAEHKPRENDFWIG